LTRSAWRQATSLPSDVRARAPVVPLSRDELLLLVVVGWCAAALAWRTGRTRVMIAGGLVALAAALPAATRSRMEWRPIALVRPGSTLRVSPVPTAPPLGAAPAWSAARLERRDGGWILVRLESGGRGWLPASAVAPVGALD
ncbi:MAG TPA: SH3 domain-containing protein, partial [Gemmatimonadales bacterium]|nr:SH3 domain-containing protein [Gemmatimonadales bacterium]